MTCVLGISVSSQRVHAEVRNLENGDRIASFTVAVAASNGLEPGELAVEHVVVAFEQVLSEAAVHHPVALAVAGPLHALVVVDGAGAAIRPALLAEDQRSAPDAGWCNKKIAPAQWAASVGSVPTASLTVTKLSWLHRSEADAWERIARFITLHDYLRSRLCDGGIAFVTDRGAASGTGYWSAASDAYDEAVLTLIDKDRSWSDAVPSVVSGIAPAGERGSARVAVGTGDLMATVLALGLGVGDVLVTIGGRVLVTGVSNTALVDETGVVSSLAAADTGYLPTISVPDSSDAAAMCDGAILALSTLSTAGIDVSGRLVICGDSALAGAVASACAGREMRTVEVCSDLGVVAAGAAVQAAARVLGQWPQWHVVATTTA